MHDEEKKEEKKEETPGRAYRQVPRGRTPAPHDTLASIARRNPGLRKATAQLAGCSLIEMGALPTHFLTARLGRFFRQLLHEPHQQTAGLRLVRVEKGIVANIGAIAKVLDEDAGIW